MVSDHCRPQPRVTPVEINALFEDTHVVSTLKQCNGVPRIQIVDSIEFVTYCAVRKFGGRYQV